MLINIPALLFLNDIDDLFGLILKKHMKVHHSDIVRDKKEEFLVFEYTDIDYKVWYVWAFFFLIASGLASLTAYISSVYHKCKYFDTWYDNTFVNNI